MNWDVTATLLGSGTSVGVPVIGCSCEVCLSPDTRDKRSRCSLLLHFTPREIAQPAIDIVIDTSTDFRTQALTAGMKKLDAVLYTHDHADHVHGIDDLRAFMISRREPIVAYAEQFTIDRIIAKFPYTQRATREIGSLRPEMQFQAIEPGVKFEVADIPFIPIRLEHGEESCIGYRVGNFAYITDVSRIPEESLQALHGLEILLIDSTRERPHPSHLHFEAACRLVESLGVQQTYFVHINHEHLHTQIEEKLKTLTKSAVSPGYDGLTLRFTV